MLVKIWFGIEVQEPLLQVLPEVQLESDMQQVNLGITSGQIIVGVPQLGGTNVCVPFTHDQVPH